MHDIASLRPVLGLDARCLRIQRTGVERMFFNFIACLPDLRARFKRVILFSDGPLLDAVCGDPLFEVVILPRGSGLLRKVFDGWMLFQLPRALKQHAVDVFYSPNTKFPFSKVPSFITVHGLEWHFQGADYPLVERVKQRLWFSLSVRFAAGIVTFANHTRNDIHRLQPRLRLPVTVVGEAAASLFCPVDKADGSVLRHIGIASPFILSVCSLEPRKNIDALIRAFAVIADGVGQDHTLVLVGRAARHSSRLNALVEKLALGNRVCFAGYVSDDELLQLYNQADFFVYPSKYEGFGLPILEAMACGTAVASSHASALREVAGDAAILFDPASLDDMADVLGRLCGNGSLRREMAQKGLRRAASFTWGNTARDITNFITTAKVEQ